MKRVWRILRGRGQPPPLRSKLLNIGCGSCYHEDWLNCDFVARPPSVHFVDLREALPFPDGFFKCVYHSHVLEHLPRDLVPDFLAECFRVLEPGGVLRVVVPDLETIAALYLQYLRAGLAGDETARVRHEWMTIELLDQLTREKSGGAMLDYWKRQPMPEEEFILSRVGEEARGVLRAVRAEGHPIHTGAKPASKKLAQKFRDSGEIHRWMYDRLSLSQLFSAAGFQNPRPRSAGESGIPGFTRYGLDQLANGVTRKPDSLFVEAEKPGTASA